jgi:hypothetical protein
MTAVYALSLRVKAAKATIHGQELPGRTSQKSDFPATSGW